MDERTGFRIARLDEASVLVTDARLPRAGRALLEEHVGRLVVVTVGRRGIERGAS